MAGLSMNSNCMPSTFPSSNKFNIMQMWRIPSLCYGLKSILAIHPVCWPSYSLSISYSEHTESQFMGTSTSEVETTKDLVGLKVINGGNRHKAEFYEIWSSHSSDYDYHCLLGCDTV
jgi:hypothetical protein